MTDSAKLIVKLHQNLVATSVIPQVYRAIISHCNKPTGQSYYEYIEDTFGVSNLPKPLREFVSKHSIKLNKSEPSSFCDVTFLHQLVHILFSDLSNLGSVEYNQKIQDTNSWEYLLKTAKDNRNQFAHELPELTDPLWIDNVKSNLEKCLRMSKDLLSFDQSELDSHIHELDSHICAYQRHPVESEWNG